LRLHDNAGLFQALKQGKPVLPIFIFDKTILDQLEDKQDRRVAFIHAAITELQKQLEKSGSTLRVLHDHPTDAFRTLIAEYDITAVYTNHDYEPYATQRDSETEDILKKKGIVFHTFKDQVIFEKDEVVKSNGEPYTVFTPYSKVWKAKLNDFYASSYPTEKYFDNFLQQPVLPIPSLHQLGFEESTGTFPGKQLPKDLVSSYDKTRDFPAIEGTSRMGVHLRFGTVSIRHLVRKALEQNGTYLNELILPEFYQKNLWHFPHVVNHAFKPAYDNIEWRNNEEEFGRWCEGNTGYPIVDAGMRQLNATGFMHNRVRMVVASFLTKHLLIDWRWGESYFAQKLLDYELASNNGGWQWAAGSGCDAAPYFRVFNPYLQTKKFDSELHYIRKWVPEFQEFTYPAPMVDHEMARKRALEVYGKALKQQ